jgi:hypothetical protein
MKDEIGWLRLALCLSVPLIVCTAAPAPAQEDPLLAFIQDAREDPAKILGADACGECHVAAHALWEGTPHATGFKTLHRKESAAAIAEKMGFRLIKRRSICFTCHYTPIIDDGELRVISGVSCESCHGAAADWIDVHNKYGQGFDHGSEPAEHRVRRIEESTRAGMRRPSDLYPVASRCFACHTVPIEELVNVGGHSTGSATFELVEWSQGEIRHNFLESFLAGGGQRNAERPMSDKRVMYVAGRALDLEYSLRGAAQATANGVYAKAMSRRVRAALGEVTAIVDTAPIEELGEILTVVRGVKVAPGNRRALESAADRIGELTRAFLARHDGERLASLDDLVLGRAPAVQVAQTDPAQVSSPGPGDAGDPAPDAPGGDPGASPSSPSGSAPGSSPVTRTGAVPAEGELTRRVRPASSHATLGPGACSGCHGDQNNWWFEDAHFAAADPFFARDAKNVKIARLFGVDPGRMTRGTEVCMDCHGSVVTGRETRQVSDGVGCEGCHGAAADWIEPHKDETRKELGRDRPGYRAALANGKTPLHEVDVRVEACVACHYVTTPRLISAGHPSGADFDYVEGMQKTRHWQSAPVGAAALRSAAGRALAARGEVPKVRLASLGQATPAGPGGSAAAGGGGGEEEVAWADELDDLSLPIGVSGGEAPRARPLGPASGAPVSAAAIEEIGGFPEITESTSIEETLLLLERRLRDLHRVAGAGGGGGP